MHSRSALQKISAVSFHQCKWTWMHMKKLVLCFIVTIFVHVAWCQAPQPACSLNVPQNLSQMNNECVGVKEEESDWGTLPKTLCCQDAIIILSKALAQNAKSSDYIFMAEEQWRNCNTSFGPAGQSCGFDNLLRGRSQCSWVELSEIGSDKKYQNALERCSDFNTHTSFDGACKNCSEGILDLRKQLQNHYDPKNNDTEKTICGLAAIISIAAGKNDSQSMDIDSMFRCFPELNTLDAESGYIKVKDSLAKALLAILAASVGIMLIILLIKYVTKDKDKPPAKAKELTENKWSGLYRFSKAEIENAISSAGERTSLGRGSAGQVFKGVLPSGQAVAIKHIYKSNTSESFTREVEGLSRIRHPNLACLFGCCVEDGDMYLVYEFCAAGNLAYNLKRKDKVLSWLDRCQILRDCAVALRFLHTNIDGCIVHRDIKLTNILLTEKLEAKLSDFGLAKTLGIEESKVFTDVRGTIGYMDPEYMTNAKLTSASDIYSFGIVVLQLLSGQKVIDLDLDARDQLTRKAKDVNSGKRPLKDFEDPRLKGEVITEDFKSILQVAVLCVAKSHKGRPSIDQVYQEFDRALKNTTASMKTIEASIQATSYSRSMEEMVSV